MSRAISRVMGIGWWIKGSWGRMLSGQQGEGEGQAMFTVQFKNIGRLDSDSKAAAYAVALALEDASLGYPLAPEITAGIAGGSTQGCLSADIRYFRDYVDCGRTLGRGNYFIYTLPTSPLAECSIHFGLEGPVLFLGGSSSAFARPLEAASFVMADAQADLMLAGATSREGALFMVIGPDDKAGPTKGLDLRDVKDLLENAKGDGLVRAAVDSIENMMKERGIKAAV